jgi:hypothetical protein
VHKGKDIPCFNRYRNIEASAPTAEGRGARTPALRWSSRQRIHFIFIQLPLNAYWRNILFFSGRINVNGMKLYDGLTGLIYVQWNQSQKIMTKGNNVLLAALGGAAAGALVANYLSTEKGKQMLNSATNTIKDLSGKASQYAKDNLGEVIRETKDSIGGVVKEKIAAQVQK